MKTGFNGLPLSAIGFALVAAASLQAAEWGTLKGRIVYDGKAPQPEKLALDKDPEICEKHHPVDESLVVGPDGGLANAVIFLRTKKTPVHPDYEKTAHDEVVIDNKNCRFEPHVQLFRTTQTLIAKNSDPMGHNTNVVAYGIAENSVVASGESKKYHSFTSEAPLPAPISCGVHKWMKGWIVIRSNPYMAVADKKGDFTIKNLPAGKELEFQLWQEKAGYVGSRPVKSKGGKIDPVTFKGGKIDSKGHFTIKIKPGDNDLGVIKVPTSLFEESEEVSP